MPYPTQMPGLDSLVNTFGDLNPMTYQRAAETYDLAKQYNQQNLLDQRQSYDQKQITNPLEAQKLQLENEGAGYNNESTRLRNQSAQRDWDVRPSVDIERAAKLSEFAKKMSDDEVASLKNHIETGLLSTDPKVKAQAQQQRLMYGDLVAEREKLKIQHGNKMGEIGAQQAGAQKLMQMQIDAGRFLKTPRGSAAAKTLEDQLPLIKDPIQRKALLEMLMALAESEGDSEKYSRYQTMAVANDRTAQTLVDVKSATQEGKPNIAGVAGVPAVARPQLPSTPSATPKAAPAKVHTITELKGMYPGKSDAEIKAAYKAKFGVEPK